jgi:hypothetical protein
MPDKPSPLVSGRPDRRILLPSLLLLLLAACSSSATGADAADGQGQEREAASDGTAAGCPTCAAGELCVQLNDSSIQCHSPTPTLVCRKVSAACAAAVDAARKSCPEASAACQAELCPAPYQCKITTPCGNESPAATVHCYGP